MPGKVRGLLGDSGQGVQFDLKLFMDGLKTVIIQEEQTQTSLFQTPQHPLSHYDLYEQNTTSTLSTNIQKRCQLGQGPHASSQCAMSTNKKSATDIRLKLCLNRLHPGHRVSHCTAKGCCTKCKGKHHSSIHGIRIHPNSTNSIPQRSAPVSSQPPSQANAYTSVVTHEAYNAASVTETSPSAGSTSQFVTTNCAPLLDTNVFDIQSAMPMPVDSKPLNDKCNITCSDIFSDTLITNSSLTEGKTSPNESNHVILLTTAKASVVVNDKTILAHVFFDEGSQCSYYIRAGFAKQLGLKPESYELLSVSSSGDMLRNKIIPSLQLVSIPPLASN